MQMFQAVSYAVKDIIIDEWIATHKEYEKQDAKTVYYLSMEFLMGRALGNNIINIGAREEIKEALDEMGIDLNVLEDQEPDAALGNGGLGRLAACFLDSWRPWIPGLRLRHPLSLWYVPPEDQGRLSDRRAG